MTTPKPTAALTVADFTLGMKFELPYVITENEIQKFSELTGDYNPIHHNEAYAKKTAFRKRIAHGMLSAIQFSTIFGMHLPGLGAVWESQSIKFLKPVYINEEYTAVATVTKIEEKKITLQSQVINAKGNIVLDGEGVMYPMPEKVKHRMGEDAINQLLA